MEHSVFVEPSFVTVPTHADGLTHIDIDPYCQDVAHSDYSKSSILVLKRHYFSCIVKFGDW